MSDKKRLFQIFDEMNVNDEKNKTALLPCAFTMVEAKTAKGGGHITMGVEAYIIQKIFLGEMQPILVVMDKKEYCRLEAIPVDDKLTAAEQRAERAEKALRDILKWELTTSKMIKVKHLDILKDIMKTANKALTPKQASDELHKES